MFPQVPWPLGLISGTQYCSFRYNKISQSISDYFLVLSSRGDGILGVQKRITLGYSGSIPDAFPGPGNIPRGTARGYAAASRFQSGFHHFRNALCAFPSLFVSLCYCNYRNIFILSESGEKDGREKYMTFPCIFPCPSPISHPEKLGILGAFLRAQWKSILGLFRALALARLIRRLPRITQNAPRSLSDAPRIFA